MKKALVIGCARGVWEEVKTAQALGHFDTIYCVKMAGIEWNQGFFHWVTLHPEYMPKYIEMRTAKGLPNCYQIVGPLFVETRHVEEAKKMDRQVSYRWKGMTSSGSSGLFAVKVAMDDGHDRIVLAGCPMDPMAGHFARDHASWAHCHAFRNAWDQYAHKLKGKVRSMSGWTKQILGEPNPEWLEQCETAQSA